MLTTVAGLARALHERRAVRSLVSVAVPGAAMVVSLGPAALPYLAPFALVAVVAVLVRVARDRRAADLVWLGVGAVVAVVLALPVLLDLATVQIDGRRVGQIEDHLNNPGAFLPVGDVALQPGEHEMRISMGGGTLAPGDAGYSLGLRHIGPLVFSPPGNAAREAQTVATEE